LIKFKIKAFFLFLFCNSLFAMSCPMLSTYYILGDYKKCAKTTEHDANKDYDCEFLKSLCYVGVGDYEQAKYVLGNIMANKNVNNEYKAVAMAEFADVLFLTGDYKRAADIAEEASSTASKNGFGTYSHIVSELVYVKTCFENKNILNAERRIEMLKNLNTDGLLIDSFKIR